MKRATQIAAMLAAGMLVTQPCAANDFRDGQTTLRQSSPFVGLNIQLPLGESQKAKPTMRLQFTMFQTIYDERTGTTQTVKPQGLEIVGMKGGKPTFYVNGESAAAMQNKLGIGGTGTTLLVAGGVILGLLVVAAASGSVFPECEPVGGNDDHCID